MLFPGLASRFFLVGLLVSVVVALIAWGFRTAPDAARAQLLGHVDHQHEVRTVHAVHPRSDIRRIRAERPLLPVCSEIQHFRKRRACAESALRKLLRQYRYAAPGLDGTVALRFTVGADGRTGDLQVNGNPPAALSEAGLKTAKRILEEYPVWEPGRRNGHPAEMQYTLPIRFRSE